MLNDLDVQSYNALFGQALNTHRAAIGLPPVDNVRAHILTDHPWLAADTALARITPCVKPCPAANSAGPDGAAGLGPLGAPRTPGANAPNQFNGFRSQLISRYAGPSQLVRRSAEWSCPSARRSGRGGCIRRVRLPRAQLRQARAVIR